MTFFGYEDPALDMPTAMLTENGEARIGHRPTSGSLVRPDIRMNTIIDPAVISRLIDRSFRHELTHQIKDANETVGSSVTDHSFPKLLHLLPAYRICSLVGTWEMFVSDTLFTKGVHDGLFTLITSKRIGVRFNHIRLTLVMLSTTERHSSDLTKLLEVTPLTHGLFSKSRSQLRHVHSEAIDGHLCRHESYVHFSLGVAVEGREDLDQS